MVLDLHKSYSTLFPCQKQHAPTCQWEIPTFELDFTLERESASNKEMQAGLQVRNAGANTGSFRIDLLFCAMYMAHIYIS